MRPRSLGPADPRRPSSPCAAGGHVSALSPSLSAQLYKSNKFLGAALALGLLGCVTVAFVATIRGRIFANTLLGPQVLVAVKELSAATFLATAAYDIIVTGLLSAKLIRSRRGFSDATDSMLLVRPVLATPLTGSASSPSRSQPRP